MTPGVSHYEWVLKQSPASKDMNMEAEEAMALEAVARQKPVKIQQTKKTLCLLYL
jgi:hypothetical protein